MLNGNIYTHLDVTNSLREQEKAIDNSVNKGVLHIHNIASLIRKIRYNEKSSLTWASYTEEKEMRLNILRVTEEESNTQRGRAILSRWLHN